MGQNEHGHDDVFGNRRFMAKHVANCHSLRHCAGVEEIESGRHRLQQAQARRGRKPGAPDMADNDFRLRQYCTS
jgi:hypothetical protein